jgi:hypothetical protein
LRIKPSLTTALGDLARADAKTLNFYTERVLDAYVEAKKQEGKKPKTRS